MTHPKIALHTYIPETNQDEVLLKWGWQFSGNYGYHKHMERFDSLTDGLKAADEAIPCDCGNCSFYTKPKDKR